MESCLRDRTPGRHTTRRYTPDGKAQAVRLVRQMRAEHGCIEQVAKQLGYGTESVRSWVRQADVDDGVRPGTTTAEAERIKGLEQEVRALKHAAPRRPPLVTAPAPGPRPPRGRRMPIAPTKRTSPEYPKTAHSSTYLRLPRRAAR